LNLVLAIISQIDYVRSNKNENLFSIKQKIVDNNERISTERSLSTFITALNKRMGNNKNFTKLIEIYSKLMDYESSGTIRTTLVQMILKTPSSIMTSSQNTVQE
jgi:hypothetical protein